MISRTTVINLLQENIRYPVARKRLNDMLTLFLPDKLPMEHGGESLFEKLWADGNVYLPALVDESALREMALELAGRKCFDPWRPNLPDFPVSETPPETNNARIRDVQSLPVARKIANHPLVLSIVSRYLGCKPTIDDIVAWWSLPGRALPKEEQFYHRDNDAARFLKLFIYLTDVEEKDGAHMYVLGSHRQNVLLQKRRRYEDGEVEASLGQHAPTSMTGSFGSAFLEDTFGLHKGGLPTDRPRLLFQVRYTSFPSNFAPRRPKKPIDHDVDAYINRLIG